jgi:hypothetical protein
MRAHLKIPDSHHDALPQSATGRHEGMIVVEATGAALDWKRATGSAAAAGLSE